MLKLLKQMPLAFFVAFRMARSKRSPTLSVVTLLSIGGVALGVLSLTVVLGVTGGFQEAFQARILGLYPHLVVHRSNSEIHNYEKLVAAINDVEGVVAASPVTFDDMMLASGTHRAGAVVKGLHLPSTDGVIGLSDLLVDGAKLSDLDEERRVNFRESEVRISAPLAKTWNTLLVDDSGVHWWIADRTPPSSTTSRFTLIDTRGEPSQEAFTLVWKGEPNELRENLHVSGKTPAAPGTPVSVGAGVWEVEEIGTTIVFEGNEFVTGIVENQPGTPQSSIRIIRTRERPPVADGEAMIRCIRFDSSPDTLSVLDAQGRTLLVTEAGGFTEYQATAAVLPGIILGSALAKKLAVSVGDELSLLTPLRGIDNQMVGPVGMMPSNARHRVTGIFESGFYDYDVRLAFVNIEAAQRFLNRGDSIRWIEVKTRNLLDLERTKEAIAATVNPYDFEAFVHAAKLLERHVKDTQERPWASKDRGPRGFGQSMNEDMQRLTALKFQEENVGYHPEFQIMDWEDLNQNLFSALKLQKVVLAMFFLIIILVGCFVVVGSQVMVIHDKTPDIAILKAMGSSQFKIGLIFAIQGLLVALVGIVLGLLGGLGICWGIQAFDYRLDPSIYLIQQLPVQVDVGDLVGIALTTLVCTLLAVIYSAWQATRKTPVSGLRSID